MDLLPTLYAALSIGGALYAINARQLMRGVLGLALFFIGVAAFFGRMGAWYLAAGQLLLFVGGVVTLFVLAFNFAKPPTLAHKNYGGIILALVAMITISFFLPSVSAAGNAPSFVSFATQFFTQYGLIVNVVLLMLFGAIMGAQYILEDA